MREYGLLFRRSVTFFLDKALEITEKGLVTRSIDSLLERASEFQGMKHLFKYTIFPRDEAAVQIYNVNSTLNSYARRFESLTLLVASKDFPNAGFYWIAPLGVDELHDVVRLWFESHIDIPSQVDS